MDDDAAEGISVGLLRLSKQLPPHEFFYHFNCANRQIYLKRIKDLKNIGRDYSSSHLRMEGYHREPRCQVQFIENRASESQVFEHQGNLFSDGADVNFLLPMHPDVDFVVRTTDNLDDFSLILLPEGLTFSIQNFQIDAGSLSDLIQFYD